jgi:hypothetical protein
MFVLLAGCGRMGFDETVAEAPDAGIEPHGADATTARLGPCPSGTRSGGALRISGTTVGIPVFGGAIPRAGVAIELSTTLDGTPMVQTSSGADGSYSLSVPISGPIGSNELTGYLALREEGLLPSLLVPDGPIDADIKGMYSPVTSETAVATLYAVSGIGRKASAGTLGIMVLDCDGVPVVDARVSITPPPAALVYTDDAGSPNGSLASTRGTGIVYALNVPVGTVTVTASKTGETFMTHDVPMLDNSHVMGTRLRPVRALK